MRASETSESREKRSVALSSVAAGVFLTLLKLVGGVLTGSLGILAEAAHSALDLGAAVMTWFAVRTSGKPPDEDHHYGHQRIENLSALGETVLLLVTCVWIVWEAVRRLFFAEVHVEVGWLAFTVVLISIAVDLSRSRALKRAANKYRSQALEADALHFSTDIASSAVVLVGLALVALGRRLGGAPWLERADALAALGVAAIVIYLSVRLGKDAIDVLLDRVPRGLREEIARAVLEVPGVQACRRVRVRRAGPDQFLDIAIEADGASSIEAGHALAGLVEERIRALHPRSDVVVHVEPLSSWPDTVLSVRGLAARRGFAIHDLAIHDTPAGMTIDLHVDVPPGISLGEAHALIAPLEADIRRENPSAAGVNLHIDPLDGGRIDGEEDGETLAAIRAALEEELPGLGGARSWHGLQVRRSGRRLYVSVHAVCDASLAVEAAHDAAEALEARLRRRFPEILRILVHTEPERAAR